MSVRTVGDIPIGGGSKLPVVIVTILAVLVAGGVWWYWSGKEADAKRDAANLEAERDTLETWWLDEQAGRREAERRAFTAEDEKGVAEALNEDLRESLRQHGLRARAVANVAIEARDTLRLEAEATTGDTIRFSATHSDSTFEVGVDAEIVGQRALATVSVLARVRQQAVISCDEEGAPRVHVETVDRRVKVTALDATVDEAVACFGRRPPALLDLRPQVTLGNGLLAGGAFALGYLLAR